MKPVLVVGAGFSGAVLARELALSGLKVLVIDQRHHVGGNCHTERDSDTQVMEHIYGPHIFNTSNLEVWRYIQQFCTMGPYINRVRASLPQGVFSLPVNLGTINQFFGLRLNPRQARELIAQKGSQEFSAPRNFEEQALRFVGRELYEAFFYGYTKKQWGCEPRLLPADILKRLPIRFNYDDNYYNSKYQGIPVEGYTVAIARILDHSNITIRIGTRWDENQRDEFGEIFYTGPIDQLYSYAHGRLGYRTVFWRRQIENGDFQGNAVINYPDPAVAHTRVHEHKHFAPWEEHARSLVLTEFSRETTGNDTPYYPKRLESDLTILSAYRERAAQDPQLFFLGRLATYRYLDMHVVIAEALAFSRRFLAWKADSSLPRPDFSDAVTT